MPSKPMTFENAVIYKIVCKDINIPNCYVGSTTNFVKRKSHHKDNCKYESLKDYHYPVYNFIRDNGNWENWSMILIENYPCKNKLELESRERYHMELLKADLNKHIPTRTDKEYYQDNKEVFLAKCKIYREKNKDIIKIKKKDYRKRAKEKIKARKSKKVECKCGNIYAHDHASRHRRTKIHQKYENHQQLITMNDQLDIIDDEITSEFNRLSSLIIPLIKNV